VRTFETAVPKTNFLDFVFRGNSKLNFTSRINDKDLILFSDVLKNHVQLVRHVDLSYNELTDIGVEVLARVLKSCSNLESLSLQGNLIGEVGGKAIAEALKANESIRYLNLANNKIGTSGVHALAKSLLFQEREGTRKSLEELNVGNNEVGHDGMIVVTSTVQETNNVLRVLCVDDPIYSSIGQETAIHFAKMLQNNHRIEKLSLRKHQFTSAAIYTITEHLLENNTLKVLDLTANKICFQGCEALAKYLTGKYCELRSLILASNRTGHYGAKAIARALSRNRSLVHLDMTRNEIDDSGLKMIAEALEANETLLSLKLYYNHFDQGSLVEFDKLSKRHSNWYWDFMTYRVDDQVSMAYVETQIPMDVGVFPLHFVA
jgi:Ran GTPase-activating protein (RanGAP) involved in mRNA processing and transport